MHSQRLHVDEQGFCRANREGKQVKLECAFMHFEAQHNQRSPVHSLQRMSTLPKLTPLQSTQNKPIISKIVPNSLP